MIVETLNRSNKYFQPNIILLSRLMHLICFSLNILKTTMFLHPAKKINNFTFSHFEYESKWFYISVVSGGDADVVSVDEGLALLSALSHNPYLCKCQSHLVIK